MNSPLKTGFAILVGAGWLFNLVAPAIFPTYQSNLAANAPLMLVLGAIFATRKRGSGDDDD